MTLHVMSHVQDIPTSVFAPGQGEQPKSVQTCTVHKAPTACIPVDSIWPSPARIRM